MGKYLVFGLTAFALLLCVSGFNPGRLEDQSQSEDLNVELEDPVRDLEWLSLFGGDQRSKRRRFDKADPRSLFAAIYNNYPYAKRFSPLNAEPSPFTNLDKRGLSNRLDPKNLFKSAYGFRK